MRKYVLALVTLLTLGFAASPAAAADPAADRLNEAKRLTTVRIDGRLVALRAHKVTVNNAARLTDAHESALEAILDKDISGLTALRAKVQTETTGEAVKADAQSMVNDYRVYLLVGPQVRLTVAADVASSAVDRLNKAYDTLAAAIATQEAAGKDMTAAKAKLAEMRTAIDAAKSALAGTADGLIAIKPGPDGDAIRAQVNAAKAKIKEAGKQLKAAAVAAKACRDLLK